MSTPPQTLRATTRSAATFWHGPPLARLDLACLRSFVHAGFAVTVYGYEPIAGLPTGVAFRDAAEIVDRRFLAGFVINGKPSLSHFSDLFRYRLFATTGEAWIDMDLLCLAPFELPAEGNFFARETPTSISSSVLRIDPSQPALATLVARTERMGLTGGFAWGATGPALLTETFGSGVLERAIDARRFFPVPWDDWWKPFVPSARDECEVLCGGASAIHLWNNIVERSGFWKDIAPPEGSFLHRALGDADLLSLFEQTYPAAVMEHIANNYRHSRTAAHMRVRELAAITARRFAQGLGRRFTGR